MEERGSDRRESINHGVIVITVAYWMKETKKRRRYWNPIILCKRIELQQTTAGNGDDDIMDEAGKSVFIFKKLDKYSVDSSVSLKSVSNSHKCRGMTKEFIDKGFEEESGYPGQIDSHDRSGSFMSHAPKGKTWGRAAGAPSL